MSSGICNVQKYSSPHDIAGLQIHVKRERQHSNSNPDIDFSRSHDNYVLHDNCSGQSFNKCISEEIKARYTGKKAIRKDAVRMVSVLFTSDNEFFANNTLERQREYFQCCLEWSQKRWGKANIISAVVHMDERTPHMHVNFIPLTPDGRLSAKDCIGSGSKALQQLQDSFYKEVSFRFGLERGSRADLDNGERPRRHQKVTEYKNSTRYYQTMAENALSSVKNDIADKITEQNALEQRIERSKSDLDSLQKNISALKLEKQTLEDNISSRQQEVAHLLGMKNEVVSLEKLRNRINIEAKLLRIAEWANKVSHVIADHKKMRETDFRTFGKVK